MQRHSRDGPLKSGADQSSEAMAAKYGILQRSNLGPLLFVVYVNNLVIAGKLLLYANHGGR